MNNTYAGIILVVAVVILIVILAVNPEIKETDPTKVNINGKVETVTPETKPVRLDFIEKSSKVRLAAQLNENGEYSIQLVTGLYDIELTYTTIGGIVSPILGTCGTYNIDSDKIIIANLIGSAPYSCMA